MPAPRLHNGMGADGARGLLHLRQTGARLLSGEATCVRR
jgi:chemotaxis response regulator CheB